MHAMFKIQGAPNKAPWRPTHPPRDVNDLLVHGGMAMAAGSYISPDMMSIGW